MIKERWLESDEAKEDRATWRVTVTKFLIALGIIFCLAVIFGCAEDRWLTKEQDAEFRENCEKVGCMVIPTPAWEQIKRALGITGT